MSTRRARIKAVAALPQRRKNTDKSENVVNKTKQAQTKELVETVIKSPKNGRAAVDKHTENSPVKAAPSPRNPSPRKSPRVPLTPDNEKAPSDWKLPIPTPVLLEKRNKTPVRDKNESNMPTASQTDVFVSPQARGSPLIRCSPVKRTPIIEVEVGVERLITPHKRLAELQGDGHKHRVVKNRENILLHKPINNALATTSGLGPKNVVHGYNSPKTPENDVMDGIALLKPISNAPKPIDLLKNEIISENAEVLFDPIVPLPSPTKVRQKLRPVPRLGPMRRNSIPGSASESEDESRRAFHGGPSTPVPRQRHDSHSTISHPNRDVNRVRNDSICSSQVAPQTPAPGSPLREKIVTKSRRVDASRRMAAMRRRKESIQREKLTMFDLIFYNPLTNPIIPDQDELKAKEATKKDEEQRKLETSKKEEENKEDSNGGSGDAAVPVPQIKLGPNGEIILDEQSLVIKQSEQRKLSDSVVREGAWMSSSTSRVYRRAPRTADWSDAETVRFYRALAALGTDFSLMVSLFPERSRRDLKLKFKKEERMNLAQIDKALQSNSDWDAERLENEFAEERRQAEEKARRVKERLQEEKKMLKEKVRFLKETRGRQSKGSQALGMSAIPEVAADVGEIVTADDLIRAGIKAKKRRRRHDDPDKTIGPTDPEYASSVPTAGNNPRGPRTKTNPMMTPNMHKSPLVLNALPAVPADIAPGSLVVLTVDDPKAPSQKAIHTYIKQADGSISSIILDPSVMSSLVSFVKKDTPKAGSSMSPSSVGDRTNTPPVVECTKRKRLASYTIQDL